MPLGKQDDVRFTPDFLLTEIFRTERGGSLLDAAKADYTELRSKGTVGKYSARLSLKFCPTGSWN